MALLAKKILQPGRRTGHLQVCFPWLVCVTFLTVLLIPGRGVWSHEVFPGPNMLTVLASLGCAHLARGQQAMITLRFFEASYRICARWTIYITG